MTTTTSKAKGNQSAAPIGDGWDDAPKLGGESERPEWLPHYTTFKDDVIAQKLTTKPEGSHTRPVLVGTLKVLQAFGEPRYFVDEVQADKSVVTTALPLHGALTSSLDSVRLDPPPLIRLAFMGEAKRARPNQRAAFIYDVRVKPAEARLMEARKDALLPVHKENKAKREGAEADEG